MIRLSILVPAYEYAEGVERILNSLRGLAQFPVELVIFDDSSGDRIEGLVSALKGPDADRITYRRNLPGLGAIANWNALLDFAKGEFCLLLHHDELPLGGTFVPDLLAALPQEQAPDAVLLDCVLVAPERAHTRRHLPMWLRSLVVRRFPQYLFRRNVIGPTSTLVVRRSLYPRFDERLRWLVDVELYVRLFKRVKRLGLCPRVQIGSILGRADSITAHLGSSIPELARAEQVYLRALHPAAGLWLGPLRGEPAHYRMLRSVEAACWNFMRLLTRLAALFGEGIVPRSVVAQSLNGPNWKNDLKV